MYIHSITAHTKESAKALGDMIQITHPDASLVFVVAMATDKDHQAFAKQLLAGNANANGNPIYLIYG